MGFVLNTYSCNKYQNIVAMLEKMAQNSDLVQKHAACLLKGDKIFAFGLNKYFNVKMPENKKIQLTVHAEIDAIAGINSKLVKGSDVLVIRIGKTVRLKNSRPCNACIEKLQEKGIRKVYYSNAEGNIVYEYVENMPKIHESSANKLRKRCTLKL